MARTAARTAAAATWKRHIDPVEPAARERGVVHRRRAAVCDRVADDADDRRAPGDARRCHRFVRTRSGASGQEGTAPQQRPNARTASPRHRLGFTHSLARRARPAPRPAGRSARGRASRRRSRGRSGGRTRPSAGSPPCSPQMPIFSFGARRAAALDGDAHRARRRPLSIDCERIARIDLARRRTGRGSGPRRRATGRGRLGEVVGAEREELGALGDLVGGQRGARHLDHRADRIARTSRLSRP